MKYRPSRRPLSEARAVLVAAVLLMAGTACDGDGVSGPVIPAGAQVAVVLNSIDRSLTLFSVDEPDRVATVGLFFDGSPVGMAVRGATVAVPLGTVPALAVVELEDRGVVDRIELPEGSGATGVAFANDSLVLVGNPELDTVTPVNIRRQTIEPDIAVGQYPNFIVVDGDRAFVINAELGEDFDPLGPGTVSVIDVPSRTVIETITLTGLNPGSGVLAPDGRLFVVNSGRFGDQDGSLSVVSTATLEEISHHRGFNDFPVGSAFGPDGLVYVTSTEYGVAIWDPDTEEFVRNPLTNPLRPGGLGSSAGVGFDQNGRLYSLQLECGRPGDVFRLDSALNVERTIEAGTCPFDIEFTILEDDLD